MTWQQVHDVEGVAAMGLLMALVFVAGILRERRKEILAARKADAIEAHENHVIESWFPGVRDELRPGR